MFLLITITIIKPKYLHCFFIFGIKLITNDNMSNKQMLLILCRTSGFMILHSSLFMHLFMYNKQPDFK